ncbi:MAG: Fic family protein [Chloroflexi bacterium]|nr:Fic family protein [Chloroflexota bacterium]
MDTKQFSPDTPGKLIRETGIPGATHAFLPDFLSPKWEWPSDLWSLLLDAHKELARLDGIGRHLPDPNLLLRPLQNREAQRSSRLEGTFTNPQQQMLFELESFESRTEDDSLNAFREVANYSRALRKGIQLIQDGVPFSQLLIRELHRILMAGVRGSDSHPGIFRDCLVQIGRPPRFIPPPPLYLPELLENYEKIAQHPTRMYDPLVDTFIMHYQFEAIHPFEDGNGRVGRLLLSLMIAKWNELSNQWLYMSSYFDTNKDEYMERLLRVSTHNDWRGWIQFCLVGVVEQARDTQYRCDQLVRLFASYRERVNTLAGSWRLQNIVDELFLAPVASISSLAKRYDITYPTAKSDITKLVSIGVLQEIPNSHPKTYFASEIFDITYG